MGDLLIKTMVEEMAELKRIRDEQANEIFRLNEEIKKYKNLYDNINAKYIIVSYNNTYEAKSTSSVNSITYQDMMQILEKKGKVSVYETDYKFFNSGKTNLDKHKERLFVCKVRE